jgi:cardiolipin synthase A/B
MDLVWIVTTVGYYLLAVSIVVYLIMDNRDPQTTFAWTFLILLFPYFGVFLFLIFGRRGIRKSKKILSEQRQYNSDIKNLLFSHLEDQEREFNILKSEKYYPKYKKVFNLLSKSPEALLSSSNNVHLITTGKEKMELLKKDLRSAKKFIHLAYFIWRNDSLTKEIVKILGEKVSQGVEVRVLYDSIGSFSLSPFYLGKLKRLGIKVHVFSALYSSTQFQSINYRNHMKIVVIDGKISYTGGMNLGEEYVTGGRYGFWRDVHLRVEGESSTLYNSIFIAFWNRVTKERLTYDKYFPRPKEFKGHPIQILTSGVDVGNSSMENAFVSLISSAKKSIYIQTPYFIPSEPILRLLKVSALSGIDVNIMITGVPDKRIPYWTAFTFFPCLLNAGVKIYHYNKGFLHSKVIVIDKEICSVGTANVDIRSFKLNYELNTFIYDRILSKKLICIFNRDLRDSIRFTREDYKRLNPFVKLRNSFFRLFSSLL